MNDLNFLGEFPYEAEVWCNRKQFFQCIYQTLPGSADVRVCRQDGMPPHVAG